jgi:hypothetical protein
MGDFFADFIKGEGANVGGLTGEGDFFGLNKAKQEAANEGISGILGGVNSNPESEGSEDSDDDEKVLANCTRKSYKTWSHIGDNNLLPVMYK